jgi:hypothetical protein
MIWMQIQAHSWNLSDGKILQPIGSGFDRGRNGGVTYSAQYTTDSVLEKYYLKMHRDLGKKASLFGDKMLAFRTELELSLEKVISVQCSIVNRIENYSIYLEEALPL